MSAQEVQARVHAICCVVDFGSTTFLTVSYDTILLSENAMSKSKITQIAIITILMISLTVSLVQAQYTTQKTTPITLSSNGTFTGSEPDIGVSYSILGAPGATGSVTAVVYNGNPIPTATLPAGTSLTHFRVITFDMNANDFTRATLTFSYTDAEVQNLEAPYAIYKHHPDTNSYEIMSSTVDTTTKTITVTLTSVNDPLLAIGGASNAAQIGGFSVVSWGILVGAIIGVVALVGGMVIYMRRSGKTKFSLKLT